MSPLWHTVPAAARRRVRCPDVKGISTNGHQTWWDVSHAGGDRRTDIRQAPTAHGDQRAVAKLDFVSPAIVAFDRGDGSGAHQGAAMHAEEAGAGQESFDVGHCLLYDQTATAGMDLDVV